MLRRLSIAVAVLGALAASGCAGDQKAAPYVERPVEELYEQAMVFVDRNSWEQAGQAFDEVERQHPYSIWARRAILMSAFSYYQANKYDEAINAADRFIALHPGNKDAPYAFYLKAMCYYEQIVDVGRDQKMTQLAMGALRDLIARYPQSEYARDARLKIDMTMDHLAGKEMDIGRYYLRQGQFVAAINRFRTVVERYQTTTHVPEALHRLAESYLSLGVAPEAQTAAAVLGYNYPGSDWYQNSYALLTGADLEPLEDRGSWISRALRGVL